MSRQNPGLSVLQRIGLAALPIGIALAAPVSAQDAAGGTQPGVLSRPWYDLRMMPDPILDQVLLFA
jgi:hypothetical protein